MLLEVCSNKTDKQNIGKGKYKGDKYLTQGNMDVYTVHLASLQLFSQFSKYHLITIDIFQLAFKFTWK